MNFRAVLCIIILLISFSVSAESLRVDVQWLQDNLQKESLVILDTRSFDDYELGHIPGAISFPDALSYQQKSTGGKIVEPDVIQQILQDRGIDENSFVVIYDDGNLFDSARVFWALEVYDLKKVWILNGGLKAWTNKQYPLTQDVRKIMKSHYIAQVNHKRIASKFKTRLATINPNQYVIDARSKEAYRGDKSTAKRFGHIPSAVNISVHENFTEQSSTKFFQSLDQLKSIYSDVPRDQKIILYCDIGKISASNYFALRELGYDVANYDASWLEWGNDFGLPIEK